MTEKDSQENSESGFERPWETSDDATPAREDDTPAADDADAPVSDHQEVAEVVPLPGLEEPAEDEGVADLDEEAPAAVDWDAMAESGEELDVFSADDYTAATTKEYVGLAEDVSRAAEEDWEMQAVAATVPGVESGLVGFDDVSGRETHSEESYEAVEQAASSDLAMRVASALVIFGLFLGSLVLGGWWFSAFVILLMVVAVGELYATVRTKGYQPLALFGILGVVLMGVGAHNWGPGAIAGWAAGMTVLIVLFFSLTPRHNPLEDASVTVLGMAWVGVLSFAILVAQGPHPIAYIFYLVVLVALNDIGAYFVGRSVGRRKLAPVISPNKSVEGLLGGLVVTLVVAAVLSTIPAWDSISLTEGLIAAVVVSVFVPLGDLVESMVKRSIGVKDMGTVLPGHGGLLDRIDGFLLAVPALYFLFRALELL